MRAKNLQYAMWLSDEFMRTIKRETELFRGVMENDFNTDDPYGSKYGIWYLMNPDQSANLSNCYDEKFMAEWIHDDELFDPERKDEMLRDFKFTYL